MIKISFLICTYNSPNLIIKCLDSIIKQKFNGKKEVVIMDGGSESETLDIIRSYRKKFDDFIVLDNKKRLPEGYGKGKWLGWKKCRGEFVFIIDQDNEFQGRKNIIEMLKPFKKEDVLGCVCRLKLFRTDSLTNQYVALMGTDPFMAYKSLDGLINLKKIGEDKGDYILVEINKKNPLITGGNCFVYRKKFLDMLGGYVQDTENISRLAAIGKNKVAVPKKAQTHHLATKGFLDFIIKKKKWAEAYSPTSGKYSYILSSKEDRKRLLINLFFIFTIFPNIYIAFKQILKSGEKAWMMHPILSFITGCIYFIYAFLRIKLFTAN